MTPRTPLRIGLVIGQLTRGGAEGQLAQLAARLDRSKFEPRVYVLSSADEPWGSWLRDHQVPCTKISGPAALRAWRLAQALVRDRIHLVHAWLYLANPVAAFAARRAGVPLVTAARNCKVQSRRSRWANALAFRISRQIVVNSQDVADYIRLHYWAPRERIVVVRNGIDTERFRPASQRSLERPVVVTAGRLVEQKNHALFLRAAAVVRSKLPQVSFAVAGDGPLREMLEQLAGSLGVREHVTFLGERGDLESVFREAHVFWLTSRWEGMPNVLLEAMASGLPVVATEVGGCREVVGDSLGGALVPVDSIAGFVENTVRWLTSAEKFFCAAQAARQRAEEFALPRMVARMEKLYHEILEQ
ncbi:MAG: glycosyltransferase [Candidatus Binatia bacterium]|nr:glycosyltransferase [Candidatus Binatia bacterium]